MSEGAVGVPARQGTEANGPGLAGVSTPESRTGPIPVTVMIFTLNEEIHLPSCFASLSWCDDIIVIDSFSTDRTKEISTAAGAAFFQHQFEGFGKQRNWALENTNPGHEWILILDADERVTPELRDELRRVCSSAPAELDAYRIKRRFYMWGRWLRYSSLYPNYVVRLVRRGRVRYINRGHAETQDVIGEVGQLNYDLIDENIKGMDEWFERQNRYSTKEAEYELGQESHSVHPLGLISSDPLVRRAALKRIAASLPARPVWYFIYSYFFRGGFMDGRDGLVFCLMKAVYQGMVVAKKYDKQRGRGDN